ncbi:Mov34/MPN/PAD-1 family protein [Teredinibacter turnerae]|uniref:Mov34/MPN/PAD-1 family protein n=1 Tax=Teredinibacter turnerae TaxID=2426 RepID=UPI00039B5541|nr:Mov34/MPN/PAD-1 family protein [Teredinibacter turnerae]
MLDNTLLTNIYAHGEKTYPEESCGFVAADGTVYKGTNIQNDLNKRDPELYPRTAKNGYSFSIKDVRALEGSFSSANPATIIYHSHPDVGAYFSSEDKDKALYMGEPIYDVNYLVADINNGCARGAKLFAYRDGDYTCIAQYDAHGFLQTETE